VTEDKAARNWLFWTPSTRSPLW